MDKPEFFHQKSAKIMTKVKSQQNSIKVPKDPESTKVTKMATMCKNMPPESAQLHHYSLSQQNSIQFCTDFSQARKKFTWSLFAWLYLFASLPLTQSIWELNRIAPNCHIPPSPQWVWLELWGPRNTPRSCGAGAFMPGTGMERKELVLVKL